MLNKNDTFVEKLGKMKQILLVLILFLGTSSLYVAQSNRFSESENNGNQYDANVSRNIDNVNNATLAEDDGPGDPPAPVPIDDYIPFLVAGALVLIAWYGRGRLRTQE